MLELIWALDMKFCGSHTTKYSWKEERLDYVLYKV